VADPEKTEGYIEGDLVKMQIKILRLFWHSKYISHKVIRNAYQAAKIAENSFGFQGSTMNATMGAYTAATTSQLEGGARCPPRTPSNLAPLGLNFRPAWASFTLPSKKFLDLPLDGYM